MLDRSKQRSNVSSKYEQRNNENKGARSNVFGVGSRGWSNSPSHTEGPSVGTNPNFGVDSQTTGGQSYTQVHDWGDAGRDGAGGNASGGVAPEKHGQRKAKRIAHLNAK